MKAHNAHVVEFIFSGTELTGREIDEECYINLYKSIYNVKPRFDMGRWSDAELSDGIEALALLNDLSSTRERLEEEFDIHAAETGMDRECDFDLELDRESYVIMGLNAL